MQNTVNDLNDYLNELGNRNNSAISVLSGNNYFRRNCRGVPNVIRIIEQSEHIGQWATPHHLSDVRRGAPSWIWDYLAHSDVTIYV